MSAADRELPTGITKTYYPNGEWRGYRVSVWVPWWPGYEDGRVIPKRFKREASIQAMEHWREDQRVRARQLKIQKEPVPVATEPEGFKAKADAYLETRRAMAQFNERKRHMELWALLFGEEDPLTLQSFRIAAQRDAWLTVGPKWVFENKKRVLKPLPLSAQEVNLRMRALENFFTVMYPKADNPVREVAEAVDLRPPVARGQTFDVAREVLSFMPDLTTPKPGALAEEGSLTRIRFETMFMTGLTHTQIGRLQETDVDWIAPSVLAPKRAKGRRSRRARAQAQEPRPLLPNALPVLRRLFELGANQPFSRSSLYRSVKRAMTAANAQRAKEKRPPIDPALRPYDLTRHTYGTEVYDHSRDRSMLKKFMGHSDLRMGEVYARRAIQEHEAEVIAVLNARVAGDTRPRRGKGVVGRGKVRGKVSPPVAASSVRTLPRLIRKNTQ